MSGSKNNSVKAAPTKKLRTSKSIMSTNISKDDNDEKDNEFQIVREYLLECPLLGQNSPAIKAALEGLEKEEKRRIRDAKLRSKFGGKDKPKNSNNSSKTNSPGLNDGDEIVVVEKDISSDSFILEGNNSNDTDMEWQDVQQQQRDEDDMVPSVRAIGDSFTMENGDSSEATEESFLGKTLARACIDAIAQQSQRNKPVMLSTPLAAIAVALHVSLRSEILGFACTGIPEKKTKGKKNIGFAPPIRELPKTEFLPRGWDNQKEQPASSSPDPLRYRKLDTGAVILTVEGHASSEESPCATDRVAGFGTECRVTFAPSSSKEADATTNPCLEFPLSEHINLDSWNAAALKASKIAPSLHYKNLSGLLSKFCRTFDLGAVQNGDDSAMGSYEPMAGMVYASYNSTTSSSGKVEPSGAFSSSRITLEARPKGYSVPSTLDQAFPPQGVPASAAAGRRRTDPRPMLDYPPPPLRGDFADDLLPSGLRDPRFGNVPGMGGGVGGTGNLMGPNHPAFVGNVPGNLPMGGPGSMQPRFDPIVPPCLSGDDPRRRRGPNGEPNPDHLPPPNSLGNNMFM